MKEVIPNIVCPSVFFLQATLYWSSQAMHYIIKDLLCH